MESEFFIIFAYGIIAVEPLKIGGLIMAIVFVILAMALSFKIGYRVGYIVMGLVLGVLRCTIWIARAIIKFAWRQCVKACSWLDSYLDYKKHWDQVVVIPD